MIRFFATRMYRSSGASQVSRPAIMIATAGVAVGLMVMILTICITQGFKTEIHDVVRRTGGDMQISNNSSLTTQAAQPVLPASDSILHLITQMPGVERVERVATCLGCLKTDSAFLGIQLVGRGTVADGDIVLSTTQAARLGLNVGDRVMAYFFDDGIRARRFTIADTYATHLNDFDETQAFASFGTVCALSGLDTSQCHYIQIYVSDSYSGIGASSQDTQNTDNYSLPYDLQLLQHVRGIIPVTPDCQPTVTTLDRLHPQVFSWLELLDMNVWVILVLMLCVAGFTCVSGLLILILERTQMIGIMKALGARFATLRGIFLYIAAIILVRGMIIGNALALSLAWMQRTWHIVRLNPADYYVDAVPIAMPWTGIIALNVATMTLTILVLIIPTYIIAHISPVKAMRFD